MTPSYVFSCKQSHCKSFANVDFVTLLLKSTFSTQNQDVNEIWHDFTKSGYKNLYITEMLIK